MSIKVALAKLLIVEGQDENLFFSAALPNHLNIHDIQVLPIGGKTKLTQNLKALGNDPKFPDVVSLAIIRDADVTAQGSAVSAATSALASVRTSLQAVALAAPTIHASFEVGPPRVGVFIMPNGADDGMLESLCMESVSATAEFACVQDYLNCLAQAGATPSNRPKAEAHAWLASRPYPDKRVGEAAQASYWPWTSQAFDELWQFLRAI
jgi:hypothetical protein